MLRQDRHPQGMIVLEFSARFFDHAHTHNIVLFSEACEGDRLHKAPGFCMWLCLRLNCQTITAMVSAGAAEGNGETHGGSSGDIAGQFKRSFRQESVETALRLKWPPNLKSDGLEFVSGTGEKAELCLQSAEAIQGTGRVRVGFDVER